MRRTWLVGDGPCKFLADRDRRHQRHHLMLYGSDAPTDTPSASRKHRRHADLSVRDLSRSLKRTNELHCGGTAENMYLSSPGIKTRKDVCAKITSEDSDLAGMLGKKKMPGKIGSAHWIARGPASMAKGSWEVSIYSPDTWEGYTINPIEKERFSPPSRAARDDMMVPTVRSPGTASEKSVASPISPISAMDLGVRMR